MLAVLYSIGILGAVTIYMGLSGGFFIALAPVYITLILFTEIARLTGRPIRREEAFIIYYVSQSLIFPALIWCGPPSGFIFRAFFKESQIIQMYIDPKTGLALPKAIPDWYAPPIEAHALESRTFLNPYWIMPIAITLLSIILTTIAEIAIALIAAQLYIDVEKLPFPTAPIEASGILTLSERKAKNLRIFSVCCMGALLYSIMLYAVPGVTHSILGVSITSFQVILDANYYLHRVLPGASLAFYLDLYTYAVGMILPKNVVISTLIGSFALYFFGNAIALQLPLEVFKEWQREWVPTMATSLCFQRSVLWIWTSFLLGAGLAVSLITFIRGRKYFITAFKGLSKLSAGAKEAGYLPLWLVLTMFIIGSGGSAILYKMLVPDFPAWILILISVLWPFLSGIVATRAYAETGYSFYVGQLGRAVIVGSGYRGIDAWLAPLYVGGGISIGQATVGSAVSFLGGIKVAYLTGTKPKSFLKAFIIALPLSLLFGFFFTELFWKMAPIPSFVFPATVYSWPFNAIQNSFFMTEIPRIYKPPLIILGFIVMLVLGLVEMVKPIPGFSLMGLLTGFGQPIYVALALFFGWLIGSYLERRLGEDWRRYRPVAIAGIAAGTGLAMFIFAATSMVITAMWPKPY